MSSGSKSAFYSCDTCHYNYAFARTLAVGLATSPVILGVASFLLFTAIVFFTSFIICLFMPSLATPSYSLETPSLQQFTLAPVTVANHIISYFVRKYHYYTWWGYGGFDDEEWEDLSTQEPLPFREPRDPSEIGLVARLVHRFVIGLSAVGSMSFIVWIWQMSLLGPLRFFGFRSNSRSNRRESAGSFVTILILVFIAIGVARALRNVYKMNRSFAKRILSSVEEVILEVP